MSAAIKPHRDDTTSLREYLYYSLNYMWIHVRGFTRIMSQNPATGVKSFDNNNNLDGQFKYQDAPDNNSTQDVANFLCYR